VLVAVAACGSAETPPNPPSVFPAKIAGQIPTDIPTAQRSALADGKVTRAEYEAAYQEFATCATAGGGTVEIVNRNSAGVLVYRTGAKLGTPKTPLMNSVEGRCYHDMFDVIEFVYQTTDPTVLSAAAADAQHLYTEQIRPCLRKNGVDAPTEFRPDMAQYREFAEQWSLLDGAGKC
jgi:hypothetical protein